MNFDTASKMDLEYDQKFEEMKKYIPFLESMIKRLESSNNGSDNPRKAQLDKIRSLRDLLLDKKKRMKMENLLKCEQVLVNLYAKVEQRDSMADNKKSLTEQSSKDKSDLNTVRNKLKSVVSKLHDDPETLPEIARATNTQVDCTPGSKEPALFQRRPNKASPSRETPNNNKDGNSSLSKRPYTRVLMSPEPNKKGWSASENTSTEKPLFSRRTPRRSPQKYSPSYKRERKKSSKQRSKSRQDTKDLNITLKVPEESLGSLNTKDILSRIINCSDNDVDIDTLRGLRSQILGELKHTGAKDDISDLILKSYKKKASTSNKKDDVEEGELSDSESETIENIYGSLVVVNKDENVSTSKTSADKAQPRKIQICLVINSEKENEMMRKEDKLNASIDVTDFETYTNENKINKSDDTLKYTESKSKQEDQLKDKEEKERKNQEEIKKDSPKTLDGSITTSEVKENIPDKSTVENNKSSKENVLNKPSEKLKSKSKQQQSFKPNFYQPLTEENDKSNELREDVSDSLTGPISTSNTSAKNKIKKDVVSEIDILQALKKEILGETVTTSHTEEITPPLHQPKVTKVSSAQEISSKKRISIENYKQKSIPVIKQPLFNLENTQNTPKDDNTKKQSLKLTEKECERFNFSASLPNVESSDDSLLSMDEINESENYGAPKSPDHEDLNESGMKPPVIIPSDPVKNVAVNTKADVDMRTLINPQGSFGPQSKNMTSPLKGKEALRSPSIETSSTNENVLDNTKTEPNQPVLNDKPKSFLINSDGQSRPSGNYPIIPPSMAPSLPSNIPQLMALNLASCIAPSMSPNIVPNANLTPILNPNMPLMNPSMTPNRAASIIPEMAPMMTPMMTPNSRSYEMTPRPNFDDDFPIQKHVYAPIFPTFEHRDFTDNDMNKMHQTHWETSENSKWEDRKLRSSTSQRDMEYQRQRNDRYSTDSYNRMDSPQTPNPSFGRMESPMTPVHPFGRSECPSTPTHPFGRSDLNLTPLNVFGRSEYHHNTSVTSQKYNKSQDPRLNRSSECDNYPGRNEDTNRKYYKGENYKGDYRRGKDKFYEHGSRSDRYRETSVGRSIPRDYDTDGSYKNDYYKNDYYRNDYYRSDFRYRNDNHKGYDDFNKRRNQRARSISRAHPSEEKFSSPNEYGGPRKFAKETSTEKLISVQSHTGRSFNIDTSFNRTFHETNVPSLKMSFDDRRRRASSVGRALRDDTRGEIVQTFTRNNKVDVPNCPKPMNFRRACSVGRELKDYNSNKNLKDIKADLRSYKFNDYYNKLQDHDHRRKVEITQSYVQQSSIASNTNSERRNRQQDWDVKSHKIDENYKYSPRSNYRDPRVSRDIKVDNAKGNKYADKRHQESWRSKSYGIVYSNDNIAKGTILASASGVRNFKIPKIKRPTEEHEVENGLKQNDGNAGKKDVPSKNERKNDDVGVLKSNKDETSTKVEKTKLQDVKTSFKKKEDDKQIDDLSSIDSSNSLSDNYDKRRTRSTKKGSAQAKQTEIESPVKRIRRIKKPLVYDSDSDSQGSTSTSESIRKDLGKSKSLTKCETIDTKAVKNNLSDTAKKEAESTEKHEPKIVEINISKPTGKVLNKTQQECAKGNSTNERSTEISELKSVVTNELCEEQNDSLDMSCFSVDDEMFNDNIASGSVLDNINALIADLDNDIEAPKINDFNDRFIKNIVGSISSNDSPISLEVNDPDFASDVSVNNTIHSNHVADNICSELGNARNKTITVDTEKDFKNEDNAKNCNNESLSKVKSSFSKVFHGMNEKQSENIEKNKKTIKETTMQSKSEEKTAEFRETLNNFNNDAIVSTTQTDEKAQELIKDSEFATSQNDKASDSFVPDSTINSNDANTNTTLQETAPDSTNEVTSEMSSDITSTEMSSDTLKAPPVASSSSGGIDSIGKLLSILEDKSKIDQLLSCLSKDSSENEKIKKKLEKLRDIVSDDEDTSSFVKKGNENKNLSSLNEKEKDKEVISTNQLHPNDQNIDNDEHHITKPELNQKLDNFKSDKSMNVKDKSSDVTENIENKEKKGIQDQTKDNLVPYSSDNEHHTSLQPFVGTQELDNIPNINEESTDKEKDLESSSTDVKTTSDPDLNSTLEETKESKKIEPTAAPVSGNKNVRKSKISKKGRSRLAKKMALNKEKRTTRSEVASTQLQPPPGTKKPSRELLKLQEDIREMFIKEDILNATGIRMCRLAKMVDVDNSKLDIQPSEPSEPVVVLEKINRKDRSDEALNETEKKSRASNNKPAVNDDVSVDSKNIERPKYKPGPKSKTKKGEVDPYAFDNDSVADSNNTIDSRDQNTDSESGSIASTNSFESSELLIEIKKKTKRKRGSWRMGVIKKKNVKKKASKVATEVKPSQSSLCTEPVQSEQKHDTQVEEKKKSPLKIPDLNCFVDKTYCFNKDQDTYECRLCMYSGNEIIPHYKKQHPHYEIPLSRLNAVIAEEAIQQCEKMNLQAVSKLKTDKYCCRFCLAEFKKKNKSALETFFWHVVSAHTGEYKNLCSECINVKRCPFNLDIPPPPKNIFGQLIGYICSRCNYTQVSLENLKTHVILRHDDEQTEVYSINLAQIPKTALQSPFVKPIQIKNQIDTPRRLRSTRSNQSFTEQSDDNSDITESSDHNSAVDTTYDNSTPEKSLCTPKPITKNKIQSKFSFENDDNASDISSYSKNDVVIKPDIKLERDDDGQEMVRQDIGLGNAEEHEQEESNTTKTDTENPNLSESQNTTPNELIDHPHFKIKFSDTGSKEYICCITKNHYYKTTLLISLKRHVIAKHKETWDGYCFLCKAIVLGLGVHHFKDCLQHYLDKHMDNFPTSKDVPIPTTDDDPQGETCTSEKDAPLPKPYINVRPLSELISPLEVNQIQEESSSMPKIQSVVSLLPPSVLVQPDQEKTVKVYKYEEVQNEIMSKKNRVVFETMLTPEKLIHVFKCAGRFCSYTTDSVEDALVHVSTHKKVGGENSLKCTYCGDEMDNAIDLVMHVFKNYSHCSYTCNRCFYRASVGQLVYAHTKRAHSEFEADKIPVLRCATTVEDKSKDDILSRDEAVMYYICKNSDPDSGATCQFKSFVLTKFREHLHARHANDQEFICSICNDSMSSPKMLAEHLKGHGLKLYQCCRCLFGADNETDLMDHASTMHPLKQPKAYLRIITSKGPNSEVRVLPLAVLSKSSVQTTVVTPSSAKENPVKEAERSIDLEKLIGQTSFMLESMSTATNEAETTEEPSITMRNPILENLLEKESTLPSPTTLRDELPSTSTSALIQPNISETVTDTNVAIKTEPVETIEKNDGKSAPEKEASPDPDVVCLDSDDDSSRQIIDLSIEDNAQLDQSKAGEDQSEVKVPRYRIYKCSKCLCVSKTELLFKKHIVTCFPDLGHISCLYCPFVGSFTNYFDHINKHLETMKRFSCTLCNEKFISKMVVSKHMKRMHSESMLAQNLIDDSERRDRPKRKLSSEVGKSSEPAAKLKKYGPQDVDKLPINPILDDLVYCSICEFSTKVRLNMVRHLQLHAEQQPVPRTAPVNPVPNTNERHFDKMVNLASSSISNKNDKTNPPPTVAVHLPPEAAAVYPKYVPARLRYTCGAKDCSYISVNESMFKFHWETLHHGTNSYHCVHCPPHQHLDTSKPLTAIRIISHLKMHDAKLYACSSCSFYYHSRKIIEKHLKDIHHGKVLVVREEGSVLPTPAPPSTPPASTAPTMDLKPWQCGLCQFKSMLRPEVIEHCGKFHQSKMQFKCSYCGFRTSNIENISKHQSKQHPGKKEEVFYFYYREGSIPDESDGLARWQKQSQKNESPEIKTEAIESPVPNPDPVSPKKIAPKPVVNLDIVKQEIEEPVPEVEESLEDLCKEFGQFCDPNGLKYKCPLCSAVCDDNKDAMQSHLYEELQYRKWGCGICSYKAFHKPGLHLHVISEHHTVQRADKEPIELQMNPRIETWVAKCLHHQTTIIDKNKENLAKQKAEILRPVPGSSSAKVADKALEVARIDPSADKSNERSNAKTSMVELEKLFGAFGVPSNMNYCCPKCGTSSRAESTMQEHLESELNKIRWRCSNCNETFQTYHEAQFHCRSVHQGQSSRPVEATRDVNLRAQWVAAVLQVQKLSMNYLAVTETNAPEAPPQPTETTENSLLVVRYEEKVPTPEEQMRLNRAEQIRPEQIRPEQIRPEQIRPEQIRPEQIRPEQIRPGQNKSLDSDDEALVIDETKTNETAKNQPQFTSNVSPELFYCCVCQLPFKNKQQLHNHVLRHYNLKPYQCPYCPHTNNKRQLESHIRSQHPNKMIITQPTVIPSMESRGSPVPPLPSMLGGKPSVATNDQVVCLTCEKVMTTAEQGTHLHGTVKPEFGPKDAIAYKCCTCLTLYSTVTILKAHHKLAHPGSQSNYSFYKLHNENRQLLCDICKEKFSLLSAVRAHCESKHGIQASMVTAAVDPASVIEIQDDDSSLKRKAADATILPEPKKVARKSTTKLPNLVSVAKKSTTKLPQSVAPDVEEYSFYGTKPLLDNLQNVTTDLPVFNKMVQFSVKDLDGIFKMNPNVLVEDIAKKKTS